MGVIAIDWSGAKRPKNKIWIAEASNGSLSRLEPVASREQALEQVVEQLARDSRTIVGLDFAFSMPAWFLYSLGVSSALELWKVAAEKGEGWLQECASPFWGRPGKRKPELQAHYRITEASLPGVNGITPRSCFQIGGAGAVGTGSIRGMPFLLKMRQAGFAIWPFDPPSSRIVVEIYPRILTGPVKKNSPECRAEYLNRYWPDLPPTLRRSAMNSEDAFDAAVSASVMQRHLDEFESLPVLDDSFILEGQIWTPQPQA